MMRHPQVYYRDCQHCLKFVYNEETGKVEKDAAGNPLVRPRGAAAPCRRKGNECPKGTPESPKTLNRRNQLAFSQFEMCCVTGRWPDDPLVIERAVHLKKLLDSHKQEREMRLAMIAAGMRVN